MSRVISLLSLKGGVGKTTIASSLAATLSQRFGQRVLLIDANYSAPNLGIHMDVLCPKQTVHDVLNGAKFSSAIHQRYGVDVVPGNFLYKRTIDPLRLRAKLSSFKKQYDFVILDSSPSLGDEFFSALFAADDCFLVTTPDYPTLSCTMKLAKLARQHDASLRGLIINRMVSKQPQLGIYEVQESAGIPVVATLREDSKAMAALFARVPITLFAPQSSFSRDIQKLGAAMVGKQEKPSAWEKLFGLKKDRVMDNRETLRKQFYISIFK